MYPLGIFISINPVSVNRHACIGLVDLIFRQKKIPLALDFHSSQMLSPH